MTDRQKIIVGDLNWLLANDPADQFVITRGDAMELLGLIDRLRAKAEGGRPPARLGGVRLADHPAEADSILVEYPKPFDGTFPPTEGDRPAGHKDPPPPGTANPL